MPSRWRVVYPSAFAQAWDCPGKCNSPGLHWYTAGVGRVVWRVGCGAGCAFVPRIYAHACHPPPGPPGLRGGVSCARGVRGVVCGVPVLRGVSLYICTRLSPPPLWWGVAGLPCAVWGCRGVLPYICTRLSPPPEKGIKERGGPVAAPPLWGVLISGFCSCRRACAWLPAFLRYRPGCIQRRQIPRRLCPVQPPL